MSKLDSMYNWNGNYKLLKNLEQSSFRVGDNYPEIFFIFQEDNFIRYTIIDDNFGMPSLANNTDFPYSLKLRKRCIDILNKLEEDGFIQSISE